MYWYTNNVSNMLKCSHIYLTSLICNEIRTVKPATAVDIWTATPYTYNQSHLPIWRTRPPSTIVNWPCSRNYLTHVISAPFPYSQSPWFRVPLQHLYTQSSWFRVPLQRLCLHTSYSDDVFAPFQTCSVPAEWSTTRRWASVQQRARTRKLQ